MSQSDLNEVKSVVRAILVANAGKYYTIKDICKDYEECEGVKLPFSQFNCGNPLEFLLMMPDTVQILDRTHWNSPVRPVVTKDVQHVFQLVCEQKKLAPNKNRKNNAPFRKGFNTYRKPGSYRTSKPFHAPAPFRPPAAPRSDAEPPRRLSPVNRPLTRPVRPPLSDAFKGDVYELLRFSPKGIHYDDFDILVHQLLKKNNLTGYRTEEVLDDITEFSYWAGDRVYLLASKANAGTESENGDAETIDLKSDEVKEINNNEIDGRGKQSHDSQTDISGEARRRGIPASLLEKFKRLVHEKTRIYTDDFRAAYARMYEEELEPEKYGFDNMDSFMKYLEDSCEDIVFRRIQERTVMRLRNPDEIMNASGSSSSPGDKSSSANSTATHNKSQCSPRARSPLPGEVTFDPFPSEVCNPDFRLETDPIVTRLEAEETFAASFTEINSPNNFYMVHINRMKLVKDMMADLDHFYKEHEAKYKIGTGLVARDLLCACIYSNNGLWHRVQVLSTYLKTAEVLYVDYGTKETVDVTQLRYLHKDFAELPALTISCKLSGIQPKDGGYKYEYPATKAFDKMCRDHVEEYGVSIYNVKIVRVYANNRLEVVVFTKSGESFQDALIKEGAVERKTSTTSPVLKVLKPLLVPPSRESCASQELKPLRAPSPSPAPEIETTLPTFDYPQLSYDDHNATMATMTTTYGLMHQMTYPHYATAFTPNFEFQPATPLMVPQTVMTCAPYMATVSAPYYSYSMPSCVSGPPPGFDLYQAQPLASYVPAETPSLPNMNQPLREQALEYLRSSFEERLKLFFVENKAMDSAETSVSCAHNSLAGPAYTTSRPDNRYPSQTAAENLRSIRDYVVNGSVSPSY